MEKSQNPNHICLICSVFFALTPKYRCIPLKKIKPDFREYIKSAKTSNFVKTPFFLDFWPPIFLFLIFHRFLWNFNLKLEETNPYIPKYVIFMQKINEKTPKKIPKLSFIQCTVEGGGQRLFIKTIKKRFIFGRRPLGTTSETKTSVFLASQDALEVMLFTYSLPHG